VQFEKTKLNFKSIKKGIAKLHSYGFDKKHGFHFEKLKRATIEETKFPISKIKAFRSSFDLSFPETEMGENKADLNKNNRIEYLKGNGYQIDKKYKFIMARLKLNEKEYKDLIIQIAIKISPILVTKKPNSVSAGENIAIYARDITDAVDSVLRGEY